MKKILALTVMLVLTICTFVSSPLGALAEGAADTWLSADAYYWSQLSEEHKAAYEVVIANALRYPAQQAAEARDLRYQALGPMICAENPRIFWIDWVDSYARLRFDTTSETSYDGMILPQGESLESLKAKFLAGIEAAAAEIQGQLSDNAGVKAKAKAIHDWLCKNNSYNSSQTSSHKKESALVTFAYMAAHSAYSAVIPGDEYEPVCEGYAGAFKILCEELGVRCIIVDGSMKGVPHHSWNLVQDEKGEWYLVDVTADDSGKKVVHTCFMGDNKLAKKYEYTPRPYMGSGVNPDNGYTEGAAFAVPALAG